MLFQQAGFFALLLRAHGFKLAIDDVAVRTVAGRSVVLPRLIGPHRRRAALNRITMPAINDNTISKSVGIPPSRSATITIEAASAPANSKSQIPR